MTTVDVTKAREHFAETINSVAYRGERVVIQKHGKAVAALVPVEDLELIEQMEDQIDLETARRALADSKNRRIPWETVKKRLGL